MKKTIILILLLALVVSLFAGCGEKKFLEAEDAQKIALEDLGIKEKDAESVHIHVGEVEEGPAFSVHIEYEGKTYEYVILAATGEIVTVGTVEE